MFCVGRRQIYVLIRQGVGCRRFCGLVLILLIAFAVILCFLDGCNVNLRLLHVGKELFMLDVDTIDIYL